MHLSEIRIYPVKGLRGVTRPDAVVEPCGLAGDRRWMVVDAQGRFLSQREHACMALIAAEPIEGGVRLTAAGETVEVFEPDEGAPVATVEVWRAQVAARHAPAADALLTASVGQPCRLVWMHDTGGRRTDPGIAPPDSVVSFADAYPVLLASRDSLADLNARLAAPITIGRFRPNLIVEGGDPWAEDGWRRIRIGDVVFSVVKPCERCIVTTIDPDTGLRPDKTEPLRTLGLFRRDPSGGVTFGQNLVAETGGTLQAGAEITLLEEGEANTRHAGDLATS